MIGANATSATTRTEPETPCLAMRRREAAAAIGISVGELDTWTKRGIIPCVRIGRIVLYPVSAIQDWLKKQTQQTITGDSNVTEK
jgi:predicted DNA-binding transcriptional regulator AlpA